MVVENYFDGYSDFTDDWENFMKGYVRHNYTNFVYLTEWPWMLIKLIYFTYFSHPNPN